MARFDEHLSELQALLAGKDPRRLKVRAEGRALLVLDDDGELRRVTITLEKKAVKVVAEGATPASNERFAVVKARFADWLRFFYEANDDTFSALKLYGDMDLLAAVGALFTTERSFVDVRAGGR